MEFCLVFCVFYVYLVHIFPPSFSVRRHGIQEISGSIPLISTKRQTAKPTPCGLVISKSGYIPSPNEAGEFTVHLLFLLNEVFSRSAFELSNFLIITMDIPCPGFVKSRGFFIFSTKGGQTNEII